MNRGLVILLVVVVSVALATAVFWAVRRYRWKKKVAELGWQHDPRPTLDLVTSLGNPPFDWGLQRDIDEAVTGRTRTGWSFTVFEYEYSGAGPDFSERVAVLALPTVLPELYVSTRAAQRRSGVAAGEVAIEPQFDTALLTRADDSGYAAAVLTPAVRQSLLDWSATTPVDLSIDHGALVAVGAPKDPDQLQSYLERLDAIAERVDFSSLQPYAVPPKVPRLGVYRQDWTVSRSNDDLIPMFAGFSPFGQGRRQRTEDVVQGTTSGLPLTAFRYRWETTHTRTVSDGQGGTRTETYTEQHEQPILMLRLPVAMPELRISSDSLLGRLWGRSIDFESEIFNKTFDVHSTAPKFAHDVIHPRMMEFLLQAQPPELVIRGTMLVCYPPRHDLLEIGGLADLLTAFLARVPGFVWEDLGAPPPVVADAGVRRPPSGDGTQA